jgi:hypothetical protein
MSTKTGKVGRPRLKKSQLRQPLTVTLAPEARKKIEQYTKANGYRSMSEAIEKLIEQLPA